MASRDTLTGLLNRQVFDQLVQAELLRGERKKSRFAILFIDINQFRMLNMQKGHIIGDKVLCAIATRLQKNIPKHDVVTRINADRFMVLVRNANTTTGLDSLAQKLLKAITEPITIEGQPHSISANIGISAYPVNGQSERQLLTGALTATAIAKKTQPNSIQHAVLSDS
jgi:diguanylate cyclase (GGDEF)-like protein